MRSRHPSKYGIILRQPWDDRVSAGGSPPIPHQFANDGEKANELDAGARHPVVGDIPDEFRRGALGFHVGPDAVAFGAEGEGEEGRAFCVGRRGWEG